MNTANPVTLNQILNNNFGNKVLLKSYIAFCSNIPKQFSRGNFDIFAVTNCDQESTLKMLEIKYMAVCLFENRDNELIEHKESFYLNIQALLSNDIEQITKELQRCVNDFQISLVKFIHARQGLNKAEINYIHSIYPNVLNVDAEEIDLQAFSYQPITYNASLGVCVDKSAVKYIELMTDWLISQVIKNGVYRIVGRLNKTRLMPDFNKAFM